MCIDDLNSVSEGNGAGTALLNAIAVWGMSRGLDKITGSVVTRDGFYEALVKWYGKRGLSVQNGWLVGTTREVGQKTSRILESRRITYSIAK